MTTPAPRLPMSRRTALGAAAWTAPVIAVAAAAPAFAATGTAITRFDPTTPSFAVGNAPRSASVRILSGASPLVGEPVTFTLADTTFVSFAAGASTATAVTDSNGVATVALVPVVGAPASLGTGVVLTADQRGLTISWTVVDGRVDALGTGSTAYLKLAIAGGQVYGWGTNDAGQLGDGTTSNRSTPVPVATAGTPMAGKAITAVSSGVRHSVALDSDGKVYTWGSGADGRLGDGTTVSKLTPVAVSTAAPSSLQGKTVVAVAAGEAHTVVLDSLGGVHAWGRNNYGQLGDGTTTTSSVPVAVTTAAPSSLAGKLVAKVTAGLDFTVAVDTLGGVHSWGYDGNSQLGNGGGDSGAAFPVPAAVGGSLSGKFITDIAAGIFHVVALGNDSSIHTWGLGNTGQLGDGSGGGYLTRAVPGLVDPAGTPLAGKTVASVAGGLFHSVALTSAGEVITWGAGNQLGQGGGQSAISYRPGDVVTAGTPMAGRTITSITSGGQSTVVRSDDGLGFAWGVNGSGELGDGTNASSPLPVQVAGAPTTSAPPTPRAGRMPDARTGSRPPSAPSR